MAPMQQSKSPRSPQADESNGEECDFRKVLRYKGEYIQLIDGRIDEKLKKLELDIEQKLESRLEQRFQAMLSKQFRGESTAIEPNSRVYETLLESSQKARHASRREGDLKVRFETQHLGKGAKYNLPKSPQTPHSCDSYITADSAHMTIDFGFEKLLEGMPDAECNFVEDSKVAPDAVVSAMQEAPKAAAILHPKDPNNARDNVLHLEQEHAKLKERYVKLHHSHHTLREQVAALPDSIAAVSSAIEGKTDFDMRTLTRTRSGRKFDLEVECTYDREFDQSIWDSLHFWLLPGIGAANSFFIAFGFLCTIVAQMIFLWAILKGGSDSSAFLSDQYPSVSEIEQWRLNSGHYIEMLDSLSGRTLVERVCNQDGSLPYSTTYQTLMNDLSSYLSAGIGVYLCTATIFVWALLIVQNFNPVVSGCYSIFMLETSHISAIAESTSANHDHLFRIATFTRRRKLMMLLMHLVRGAVVLITGITGSLWLAATKNLSNLILNASALSLILTIDQLTYAIFLPKKLQSLVQHAQPLQLPAKTFGGVLYTLFVVASVVISVMAIVLLDVLPDEILLTAKERALCAGNVHFVYTRHHPTNTVYASSTTEGISQKAYVTALTELMASDQTNNLHSDTVAITPNFGKITLVHSETMQAYTEAYMAYCPFCMDTVSSEREDFQMNTVRRLTNSSHNTTCPDMQAYCNLPDMKLLRLLCPETCGCANPESGLVYRVVSEGCAVDLCTKTSQYAGRLKNLTTCNDRTPEDLRSDPAWQSFWLHLTQYEWLSEQPAVESLASTMLAEGCGGIESARLGSSHIDFCMSTEASASRPGIGSLRAFCSETCRCIEHTMWERYDCPTSCYYNSTASS